MTTTEKGDKILEKICDEFESDIFMKLICVGNDDVPVSSKTVREMMLKAFIFGIKNK